MKQKAEVETPRDETCRRLDPHRTRASDLATVLVQPGDLFSNDQVSTVFRGFAARPVNMLGLRTTTRYASLIARSTRASCSPPLLAPGSLSSARTYALSRFEKSRPGVGRERPKLTHRQRSEDNPRTDGSRFSHEDRPSAEKSPLWEQTARSPANNPEEGLQRLLMENDRLVVTRCVLTWTGR